MVTIRKFYLAFAILAIFAAAALAAGNTVDIKSKEGLGSYLVDSKGMTLYYFQNDSAGKSACAGPCLGKWPLFSIESVILPETLNARDFGSIVRDDGKKQSTYKGMPLYYFAGDKNPGDTNGEGIKDVWHVVKP